MTSRLPLAVAALAAAAVIAAPATAADPLPEPSACSNTFTDKAGDARTHVAVQDSGPASENADLTQGFLRYTDAGGKPRVTANIRVVNLDKTIQEGFTAHQYTFFFTVDKVAKYVSAVIDITGAETYFYGTNREVTDPATAYEGDTTGKLYEGKDGIIEIDLPYDALKLAGKSLTATSMEVRQSNGRMAVNVPPPAKVVYVAPIADEAAGRGGFVAAPCATVAVPVEGVPPVTAPKAPAKLKLKVGAGRLNAKKVNRARALTVSVQGLERISGLTAKLKRGSKVVASGRMASLEGPKKLKLKLARRAKLAKGTYSLQLAGKGADGRAATATFAVRVR